MVFIVEILVCFNTSYFDIETNLYVSSRTDIMKKYLKGWFWVDFLAILPRIMRVLESEGGIFKALEFLKIARISRLFKLLRLLKMLKTLKQKDKMKSLIQNRMSVAKERLVIFSVFAILFVHTIACIWIMLSYEQEDQDFDNWINTKGYDYHKTGSMYIIAVYWTITTITTVGYGDIAATNTTERIVASVILVFGVIAFSFSTGALSSVIANSDSRQATYR